MASGSYTVVKTIQIPKDATKEKTEAQIKKLSDEVAKLRNLKPHVNLAEYLDTTRDGNTLKVRSKFIPGEFLAPLLLKRKPFNEDEARTHIQQLLTGLGHLHDHDIVHGNLKAENILVCADDGSIVLTGYGLSTIESTISGTGTKPPSGAQTGDNLNAVDIWRVGCVMIEMVADESWKRDLKLQGFSFVMRKNNFNPIPDHLSSDAKDFLNKCLQRAPYTDSNCNTSELLKHPFVSNGGKSPAPNGDSIASNWWNVARTKGSEAYAKGSTLAGEASTAGAKVLKEVGVLANKAGTAAAELAQNYKREREKAAQNAARKAEAERHAEMRRKAEAEKRRKVEAERQAEMRRKTEAENRRKAEAERQGQQNPTTFNSLWTSAGETFTKTSQVVGSVGSYLSTRGETENNSGQGTASTSAAGRTKTTTGTYEMPRNNGKTGKPGKTSKGQTPP